MDDRSTPALGKISAAMLLALSATSALAVVQTTIAPNAVTAPKNGFVATGSSGARHLWISDHLQGLCRMDPALDSPGPYSVNAATCVLGGSVVFNPASNHAYIADEVANSTNQGVIRKIFNSAGGGGHGTLEGADFRLGDGTSCGVSPNRPSGLALGPDGNLYLSLLRSGNIVRIANPSATAVPCTNFVTIATLGRRNEGVAFAGHNLYGLGEASPWKITNADSCLAGACVSEDVFTSNVLLPTGIGSNQQGQTANGTALFIADIGSVTKIENPNTTPSVIPNWATGLSVPLSVSVDNLAVAKPDIFVGDDPTEGDGLFQGKIVKVSESDVPIVPGAPQNVSAVAGDGIAAVSWNPGTLGSAVTTGYTVHSLDSLGNPTSITPQNTPAASPAPTSLTVTGLSNGAKYRFKVSPINTVCGSECPLSELSNLVTPKIAGSPDAPTDLIGTAGNNAVALSWIPPVDNGDSPISHYIVRGYQLSLPGFERTVSATSTVTTISGLLNDTVYNFEVFAVNVAGESAASNTVELMPTASAPSINLSLNMQGPVEVFEDEQAVYELTVQNTGGLAVPAIRLTNVLPAAGFTGSSFTTTMGECIAADSMTIECNNANLNPGESKTVAITLNGVTQPVTNSASVTGYESDGTTQIASEANAADNNASVTTAIAPPPVQPVTDLQIGARTKSRAILNNNLTYTWALLNGVGQANKVVFTMALPSSLTFVSATANGNTCVGVVDGKVTCNIPSIAAGGQASLSIVVRPTVLGAVTVTGFANFAGFSTDTRKANNTRSITATVR